MTPKIYFDEVRQRCELFAALRGYVSTHATAAVQPDELLRAEWAARVSALDLYVHELVGSRRVHAELLAKGAHSTETKNPAPASTDAGFDLRQRW